LLDEFNIEIAGGFGAVKGKIWRVGLMGYCSQKPFVLLFLAALEKCLLDQGFRVPSGAGVGAAIRSYSASGDRCRCQPLVNRSAANLCHAERKRSKDSGSGRKASQRKLLNEQSAKEPRVTHAK